MHVRLKTQKQRLVDIDDITAASAGSGESYNTTKAIATQSQFTPHGLSACSLGIACPVVCRAACCLLASSKAEHSWLGSARVDTCMRIACHTRWLAISCKKQLVSHSIT